MKTGDRIKFARENSGLKQSQVAEKTGIGKSSLSEFENGKREPSVSQLQALAKIFKRSLSFFLSEEPLLASDIVLWREMPDSDYRFEIESRFLELCRQYHNLEVWIDEQKECKLPFASGDTSSFSYEKVKDLAVKVQKDLGLGERPAWGLLNALEENCGVKVFHMEFSNNSGFAACTVSELFGYAILINSDHARWRRNFDLAHELFHLLTWSIYHKGDGKKVHVAQQVEEKFAQGFAARLLMPDDSLRPVVGRVVRNGKIRFADLFDVARQFDVSVEALIWRLVILNYVDEKTANELVDRYQKNQFESELSSRSSEPAPQRPARFESLARKALRRGEISIGRYAEYVGISRYKAMKYFERENQADEEITITAP
jgi:Zn-dependent peptidase ImmA (M78 family)/transcriptional regulator with XRE-family HTH domain